VKSLYQNIREYKNNGASREDRLNYALDPEFFKIDNRGLNDFADFAVKFGELLNYYNGENNIDGDWSTFFKDDESFILIQINAFNLSRFESKLHYLLFEIRNNPSPENAKKCFEEFFKLIFFQIKQIDQWNERTENIVGFNSELRKIIDSDYEKPDDEKSKGIIDKNDLSNVVSKLVVFAEDIEAQEVISGLQNKSPGKLSKYWKINLFTQEGFTFEGSTYSERIFVAIKEAESMLSLFINLLGSIVKSSGDYLENHLLKSGNVQPHIGLFITFVNLYRYAQKEINGFTLRHLEYYFKEVLKFENKLEIPDKAYLFITPGDEYKSVFLKEGTLFSAGIDSTGNTLHYELIRDFSINHTTVNHLLGVFNENDSPVFDLPLKDRGLQNRYIIDNGVNTHNITANRYLEEEPEIAANTGFSICSSIFCMEEGLRRVNMQIHFSRHSFNIFLKLLKDFVTDHLSLETHIDSIIQNPFKISYSTEEGEWYTLSESDIEFSITKDNNEYTNSFTLKVGLEETYPPVVMHEKSGFDKAGIEGLPIFKFEYKHQNYNFFNFYKLLEIDKIDVEVDVLGVKNLIVQNDFGPMDITSPFEPFGPSPSIGSSFYIGHQSIFNHKINELRLVIDWFDVPSLDYGWAEHYQGYSHIDSNEVFKAKVSIRDNYKWLPEDNEQIISLFETIDNVHPDAIPVNNNRIIDNINTEKLQILNTTKSNENQVYSKSTRNGFIKLDLCYPPNGFGHKEYPELLKSTLTEGMKRKVEPAKLNEPYTPRIKELSVDYSARVVIDNGQIKKSDNNLFYQLYPFGKQLINGYKAGSMKLFPSIPEGSELFLGFEDIDFPQTLNLYFHIDPNKQLELKTILNQFKWYFLENNNWVEINEKQIIYNDTFDLLKSGILVFDFPKEVELENNTILPSDIFWLKLEGKFCSNFIESIELIKSQAVLTSFVNKSNDVITLNNRNASRKH
jgi:hypothetical protein